MYLKNWKDRADINSRKTNKNFGSNSIWKIYRKRFGFKETIIKIEYIKLPPFTIIEEWKNIIEYIAYKYPLTKALLKGSIVNVDGNNVNINLALKGKDILETRRFDQIIAETMMNLYNQKCNVKFVEKPLEDIMLHLQEQNKN